MTHRTVAELEAGLDVIRQSPADQGRLEMIVRRPRVGEREILTAGQLDLVNGLVGDARSAHPEKQLTIMNSRIIALLAGSRDRWALAGDQLLVDLDLSETNVPPGTRLQLGSAIIEVTAPPHTGCHKFSQRFGADATMFVNSPAGRVLHLRGLNAKVVQSGPIRVGDRVTKINNVMNTINFTRGVPANESFPIDEVIDACVAALKAHGAAMLQYGPAPGFQPLREWIAEWQRVTVDRVLLGNGSLQLIEFLCLHMLEERDVVFTEAPTYDRTLGLLRRHGAEVVGIPMEADGPNIDSLERALTRRVPKFLYTIPDFQNPTGCTCSGAKRRQIVDLAARYGFLIVEDAPYRLLRYRGNAEPTLYELAPDRTLHMSSFTKLIAPGVRAGFMIGDARMIAALAKIAEDTYISPGYVAEGLTFEWCRRGLLMPQIERLKTLYAPRLDACLAGLNVYMPDTRTTRPEGGFFVSLTLPEGVLAGAVRTEAATRGLNLADGLAFFPNGGGERFLRLPFCALSPIEIDDGIRRLAESVRAVTGS